MLFNSIPILTCTFLSFLSHLFYSLTYFNLISYHTCNIIFSWTENKDNKKLFFEQLGEWYTVEDTSPNTTTTDTTTATTTTNSIGNNGNGNGYCLLQPNITCHYRDKPSIIPCTNSPPIVKNGISFW